MRKGRVKVWKEGEGEGKHRNGEGRGRKRKEDGREKLDGRGEVVGIEVGREGRMAGSKGGWENEGQGEKRRGSEWEKNGEG